MTTGFDKSINSENVLYLQELANSIDMEYYIYLTYWYRANYARIKNE